MKDLAVIVLLAAIVVLLWQANQPEPPVLKPVPCYVIHLCSTPYTTPEKTAP